MNELHLGTRQLNHIAIFQRGGFDAKRRSIECWVASAFDMVNKKTAVPSGDGRDSHPRFTNGGHHFAQRNLAPCRGT